MFKGWVGTGLGHMVLEYVIIGLICLQIVLGFASTKFLSELIRNAVMEMVEDIPPALAEALSEAQPLANMEGISPVQIAVAELIGSLAKQSIEPPSQGEDGRFVKKLTE